MIITRKDNAHILIHADEKSPGVSFQTFLFGDEIEHPERLINAVIADYQSLMPNRKMVKIHLMSIPTIRKLMGACGIQLRKRGGWQASRKAK